MGTRVLPLEDDAAGYAATELDLGFPEVREVISPRPGADGVDDRTSLMGSRAITVNVRALAGGTLKPDEVATIFAPFMVPSARPELHYVLDRAGEPERMAVVRSSGYGWPVTGSRTREIHLSWIAADPIFRDPAERSSSSRSGSTTIPGRTYPLHFARIYPVGGGAATTGTIESPGDVAVRPLFRIFGPITDPRVEIQVMDPLEPLANYAISFVAGTRIDAGHWIDIDTDRRTALWDSDPLQSAMSDVDWSESTWPRLPPSPAVSYMNLYGDSTSGVTQVEATWTDGYLS
jgi:hypothetical protein